MTQEDIEFVVDATYRLDNPHRRRIAQRVRYVTLNTGYSTKRKAQAEVARLVREAKGAAVSTDGSTLIRIEVKRVETTTAWEPRPT